VPSSIGALESGAGQQTCWLIDSWPGARYSLAPRSNSLDSAPPVLGEPTGARALETQCVRRRSWDRQERDTASPSALSCSILISRQSLGGGLAEGPMGVFPLAATMGDRTTPMWARPGWWRRDPSTRSRFQVHSTSAQRFDQLIPTSSARHADLALRRFPAYIQGNQFQRTPVQGPRPRRLWAAIAIERGPPAFAA
jgi:hypothetical protein